MTLNEFVKLTTLWTTGPWTLLELSFPSTNQIVWNVNKDEELELYTVYHIGEFIILKQAHDMF